jgi:hypothetical protein
MYSSTLSLTSALDGGGWSTPRLGFFTPGNDPVPVLQEAGWAPGPVSTGAENLAPPGFDPRTVQLVASRYTDYAIPVHLKCQLVILLMTPTIVLSAKKTFSVCQDLYRRVCPSVFLFYGNQIEILVTIARPGGNIKCHWNARFSWYYCVDCFRKRNTY